MADLGNHFGEDATLDEQTRKEIETYLVANAGAPAPYGGFLFGIREGKTLLRITELPMWVSTHYRAVGWRGPKSNCQACHKNADGGVYEGHDG
ncbi:hypothetical protein JCM17960_15010 [Magnetospira thiophila]